MEGSPVEVHHTNIDWTGQRVFRTDLRKANGQSSGNTLVPAQGIVGNFRQTFKEFPLRQKAASFTIDQVNLCLKTRY